MSFKVALSFSKTYVMAAASALAIFAAFEDSCQTSVVPDIFHHWPHFGTVAETADIGSDPNIFHHWPHIETAAIGDEDAVPDIFHHWPHVA